MGPLMVLSVIALGGAAGGWVARRLHVPGITGNIVAGAILGYTVFKGIDPAKELQPLSSFAMALIAASVGGQLSYRRIHNALRRILTIAVMEGLCTATLVTFATRFLLGVDWPTAALLGCIAVATAPATTVAIVRENRAKGTFVKTLLAVVAVDNIICIMLFAFVQTLVADYYDPETSLGLMRAVLDTGVQLVGSVAVGFGLGAVTERLVRHPKAHNFSATFMAILVGAGLSSFVGLSPPLTALFFGMYLGNRSKEAQEQLQELEPLELLLYICFFTLAGAGLHLESLAPVGFLCVAYVVIRVVGKGIGASLGGIMARSSRRIWANMPLALAPQAGLAIGLVVLLEGGANTPEEVELASLVGAIVLAAVTINEIIGPFLTRASLKRAKEADLDRPRLIEFLQEEFILADLRAKDKWEALRKLTDFYVRTHAIGPDGQEALYASIEERERDVTTAIGRGAAIPHGRVESGSAIQGVLGICREGVDFHAPDQQPVRLIMLIVTPKEHEQRHLEVLGSLAAMVSDDRIRDRLVAAIDANDAWEIIEDEETREFNYFLGDNGDETETGAH